MVGHNIIADIGIFSDGGQSVMDDIGIFPVNSKLYLLM